MIFLVILITFFSSTEHEPVAAILRAPSAEACAAKAAEVNAEAEKDSEVEGYSVHCVTVPTKS